jgi:hypothetical protein
MRLTNLVRKAHCVVAKAKRDNGKPVNLREHKAAARNAGIPFLLLPRLEPVALVGLLRPLLLQKRIVVAGAAPGHTARPTRTANDGAAGVARDSMADGLGVRDGQI